MLYTVAPVVSLRQLSPLYAILVLQEPNMAKDAKPGQFAMLTPYLAEDESSSLFLKRPISLFSVDKENGFLSFYYQVNGKGTQFLSSLKPGDKISVLGPLGRGFRMQHENKNLLLVGAGVGMAPFKYLYDELHASNPSTYMVFGGRNADAVKICEEFSVPPENRTIVTDDGSIGEKTNVVEVCRELFEDPSRHWDYLYACGPSIVLDKIGALATQYKIPGQLSLESRMGCGVRACQACSIKTKQGIQKICSFGPVFDIQNLMDSSETC